MHYLVKYLGFFCSFCRCGGNLIIIFRWLMWRAKKVQKRKNENGFNWIQDTPIFPRFFPLQRGKNKKDLKISILNFAKLLRKFRRGQRTKIIPLRIWVEVLTLSLFWHVSLEFQAVSFLHKLFLLFLGKFSTFNVFVSSPDKSSKHFFLKLTRISRLFTF